MDSNFVYYDFFSEYDSEFNNFIGIDDCDNSSNLIETYFFDDSYYFICQLKTDKAKFKLYKSYCTESTLGGGDEKVIINETIVMDSNPVNRYYLFISKNESEECIYNSCDGNNNISTTILEDSGYSDNPTTIVEEHSNIHSLIVEKNTNFYNPSTIFNLNTNIYSILKEEDKYLFSTAIEENSNIPSSIVEKNTNFYNPSTIFNLNTNIYSTLIEKDKYIFSTAIEENSNIPSVSNLAYTYTNTEENILLNITDILKDKEPGKVYNIKRDNYTIIIRPTNSTIEPNSTYVNISECESILRTYYNLPNSSIVTLFQLEIYNNNSNSLINQVEYKAYDQNFTELNLKLCNGTNIQIVYAIKDNALIDTKKINSLKNLGIDAFNINDSFFWDICRPFSDMGNDLILEDRIKDLFQNYLLCEEGCIYKDINLKNMTISCDCKIKENFTTVNSEINLDQIKYETSSNFEIIKCYNIILKFNIKMNNIGFCIFSLLIFFNVIFLLIYFYNGITPVYSFVINQMSKYGYLTKNFNNKKVKNLKCKMKKGKKINNKSNPPLKNGKKNKRNKIINNLIIIKQHSKKDKKNNTEIQKKRNTKRNKKINKINCSKDNSNALMNKKDKLINLEHMTTQNPEDKNLKNIVDFPLITININGKKNSSYIPKNSSRILNNYTFKEAIKYDDRSICQIFFIYLLSKQILFHTFFFKSPFEIFPLRLCLLIFIFSSDLALNAFFYFSDNISKKYHYAKNLFLFAFSNNITVILLSTFVGFIFLTLFIKLSNSTNALREVFRKEEEKMKKNKKYKVTEKRKFEIKIEIEKIFTNYKIKIFILICTELLLLIFFWYYVTIFCHVYPSTQTSWLLDSFLSMLSRFIIDALICLGLSKLYRIGVESNVKCIYNIAMFLYGF